MNYFQKIIKENEWQELLEKALFKTFFHNLEWEKFLEKNFKWLKFERYLYKNEALLSFAKYKIFGQERLISHPFCEYGGPLPLKNEIDGREFRTNLFSDFQTKFQISFHPQMTKYFKNIHLKEGDSSRDTYFIEDFQKKTANQIFSALRKTLRHSIKKGEEKDIIIKKCQNEIELKEFYRIYLETSKKNKTIPYPLSFFQYFLNYKDNEIILAKIKNKIIAGSVFLFYSKIVHYFLNASKEQYKDFGVNHLILWNQIKNYEGQNYQIFDLGGTKRNSSLEIFKRGWGAKKYSIFELKNFSETKIKESKLRNILSVVPSFLMEKLSPNLIKYKL